MTTGRGARLLGTVRPVWASGEVPRWRGAPVAGRVDMRTEVDRLLRRAVLVLAALLALVLVAGVARRALALPAASPASAVGAFWLVGCAAALGWLALVALDAYRDGAALGG